MAYPAETKLKAKVLWVTGSGTDQQIADRLGIQRPETIGEWRRAEGWDQERLHIQRLTEERITRAVTETLSEANSRHLKEYQLMQTKGVQALKTMDPKTAAEAMAMIDTGVKGERLVRGEPTEVREVRSLMQANVQVLELVVADVIKALVAAGRMDKRLAKAFAEEFADKVNRAPFQYAVDS